jgi:hypothetical protein
VEEHIQERPRGSLKGRGRAGGDVGGGRRRRKDKDASGGGFEGRFENGACGDQSLIFGMFKRCVPWQGLGFRIQGLGFRVQGLGFRVWLGWRFC